MDMAEGTLRERFACGEIPAGEYVENLHRHLSQEEGGVLATSVGGPKKRYEEHLR